MATIPDYLDWRGDLSLTVSPLNEVDCYILCKLADPDASGILPADGFVTIGEYVRRYFAVHREEKLGLISSRLLLPVIRRLEDTVRFCELPVGCYENITNPVHSEQFSALTVLLPGGVRYIAFRGTDDSIAAWKEDLLLSVRDVVKAQEDAADYLRRAAELGSGPLIVGGHSKGGNLAVYAAATAPRALQDRIAAVYNFDGPGFYRSILTTSGYGRIRSRVHTVASQHTVVAKLLCHETRMEIVRSTRSGAAAHDGLRWEVLGTKFVRCADFSIASKSFDAALDEVQAGMGPEGWEDFIQTLFDVLAATGAVTLTDLTEHKLRQAVILAREIKQEPAVYRFIWSLAEKTTKNALRSTTKTLSPSKWLPRNKNNP